MKGEINSRAIQILRDKETLTATLVLGSVEKDVLLHIIFSGIGWYIFEILSHTTDWFHLCCYFGFAKNNRSVYR